MKFTVSSTALYQRLQAISRVVSSKNSIAILDCFLLELEGQKLTLTASDNETTLSTTLEVIASDGDVQLAIPMKTLLEGLKEISEQPLSIEIQPKNFSVLVEYQNGQYSLMGQNAKDFPKPQEVGANAVHVNVAVNQLLDSVNKCTFAIGEDDLRKVMNGIYFDIHTDKLTLVATDGHKMVRQTLNNVQNANQSAFILPKKPAGLLKALLTREDENSPIAIDFDETKACFSVGGSKMVCRLIEGRYPNYNAVIPQNNPHKVLVDRVAFISALKRVAIFSSVANSQVKLSFSTNQINISTRDIDFSTAAEENLACEYNGSELQIGFKSLFLIDILNNIPSTQVILELADPSRAGLILPAEQAENEDLLMLLMPMVISY